MSGESCDENKLQGQSAGQATLERQVKEGLREEVQPRSGAEQGAGGRRVMLALMR